LQEFHRISRIYIYWSTVPEYLCTELAVMVVVCGWAGPASEPQGQPLTAGLLLSNHMQFLLLVF
jgi:hypothetical protein